ncbi:class I SAM-dependent methyltransferase [Egbenema bharatensis]|uniref:class I SAM-dependent methyltransferase n=1 Tax=Egbenema bharatensis TaxID=3463334 RepID=UPI003A8B1066
MSFLSSLKNLTSESVIWPSIDYELKEFREKGLLNGIILNAGAGWRNITHLIDGTLINQDISWEGDTRTHIDIYSPIHQIPKPDNFFDCILCIAVLEHVINPEEIIPEFFRVCKPGGHLIASVPFLQPEHKVPTDYQRYTQDGLSELMSRHGFEVIEVKPIFSIYHTLYWIVYEWLNIKQTIIYKILKFALLPSLALLAKNSTLQSPKIATAFQVLAKKPVK